METYKIAVLVNVIFNLLSDDYIKFIRFAQDRIERTGYGIVGMITNNAYLDQDLFIEECVNHYLKHLPKFISLIFMAISKYIRTV